MSMCKLILLLQGPLCHPWLLICHLLNMLLSPPLLWALILGSHQLKLVFSRFVIQQILVFWAHMDFFMLFLNPLSQDDSNMSLRILLDLLPQMWKFELYDKMTLGFWFLALPTPTLCFTLNICLVDM